MKQLAEIKKHISLLVCFVHTLGSKGFNILSDMWLYLKRSNKVGWHCEAWILKFGLVWQNYLPWVQHVQIVLVSKKLKVAIELSKKDEVAINDQNDQALLFLRHHMLPTTKNEYMASVHTCNPVLCSQVMSLDLLYLATWHHVMCHI